MVVLTGNATEIDVPSSAAMRVRTASVTNTRMPLIPSLNSSVGLSFLIEDDRESSGAVSLASAASGTEFSAMSDMVVLLIAYRSKFRLQYRRIYFSLRMPSTVEESKTALKSQTY
jgi:hypothetical protein